MKNITVKIKRYFLLIAGVVAIGFSVSGCAFIPTGYYLVAQVDPGIPHARTTYEWPCGNILRLNTVAIQDILADPDDEVLPPDLDRALKVFCIAQAYPVSLVYDVLFWPYELWRFYHRPPLTEEEKIEAIKKRDAVVLNIDMPREIRRNESFSVKISFAGILEGKNLVYRRSGQNFKVVFVAPTPVRHEAVAVLSGKPPADEPVTAGKVYEESFKVDAPELAWGRRYTVEVKFIPDEKIGNLHEDHCPRWVQVKLIDPSKQSNGKKR